MYHFFSSRRVALVCGVLGVFALCLAMPLAVSAEIPSTIYVQVKIADDLSNFSWEQSCITVSLLGDRQDLGGQLTRLQEESKPQLEPLIKQYMFAAEQLTHLRGHKERTEEREQTLRSFHEQETRIQHILDDYTVQIAQIFQQQTLQIRREEGRAVEYIEFHEIPPGNYRVHAVLTFSTTTLHWFEALRVEGGDTALCVLTREKLNNPYWTELNWWSFINLDFSKHH